MQELQRCFDALSSVVGDDGQPLVEQRGVELRLTEPWRDALRSVDEELLLWSRAFRRRHGQPRTTAPAYNDDADDEFDEEIEDQWDVDEGEEKGEREDRDTEEV